MKKSLKKVKSVKIAELTKPKPIRFPLSLWEALRISAEDEGRTIAGEVIFRLRKSFK